MTRNRSKYEQAWRDRTGHSLVSKSPTASDCDCGHPLSFHREDSFLRDGVLRCGFCPPHSKIRCACIQPTQTGVSRGETFHKGAGSPPAPAASATSQPEPEDPSVHVGHTAEDCPYPAPRESIIAATFTSSNITGAELDTTTGILTVSFVNGSTYRYRNFTAELMTAWKEAKSAGSWFHHNVKARAAVHPLIVEVADGGDHVE